MKLTRRSLAAASAAALLPAFLITGCGGGEEPATPEPGSADPGEGTDEVAVLRFSAIPDQNSTELKEKFDPMAGYLSGVLGVPVEFVPASDYPASVEMFRNGQIHLAWFGGLTGVQARHSVEGAVAIAQGVEPSYHSYFIAHKDSGIEPSEDFPAALEGKDFTFGSAQSTSGRLMPEFFIREASGKGPEEFFGELGFSGNHDATVDQVAAGQVPAGAVSYTLYDKRVANGTLDPEVCRIIWKTPDYADYNFTAHPELEEIFGEGFIDKLQAALIGMTDPELLSAFPRSGMIEAKNEDFQGIVDVAKQLDFLR